ncbi:MAG: hypothetical protein R6X02_17430 [Enhygromyxa sp.]
MSSSDEIDLDAKLSGALGSEAAGEIARTAAVGGQAAVEEVAASNQAIAEGLASGALDPVAAQQLLIDQVLVEQLPPDIAPEQLERLRGELAALLQADPALLGLLEA